MSNNRRKTELSWVCHMSDSEGERAAPYLRPLFDTAIQQQLAQLNKRGCRWQVADVEWEIHPQGPEEYYHVARVRFGAVPP